MDSKLFLQKQISSGDAEKISENTNVVKKTQGFIYADSSLEVIKACGDLESWEINAARIRNKLNCWTSCTTSERRNFVSVESVWTARKLVDRSNGVLLLSPTCARTTGSWPVTSWSTVQFTTRWADHSIWSRSKILSHIIKRSRSSASVRYKKSFLEYSLDATWTRAEVRLESFWQWIRSICKQFRPLKFM